jgi:predicted DNA-binding mobile mystery protein A
MTKTSAQQRRYLDAQLARLRLVVEEPRPRRGWIRAVRDALGMSSTELAARMALGQSTVSELERSETRDSIRLGSLRRAADALECDLIYFLVPRTTLDESVREQARRKAPRHRAADADRGSEVDDEIIERLTDRPGLWSEPSESGVAHHGSHRTMD